MPFMGGGIALAGIAGGLLSSGAMKGAARDAANAQKAALSAYFAKLDAVGMPPDQSAKVILDQYKQAGILTPELEQQIQDSASQFQQIKRDDATRQYQVQALKQMSQMGRAGLTPDEVAEMRRSRQAVQQDLEAKQQQIVQNLAARGQAGGGAEIAQRLLASQSAADRQSEEADRTSAIAAQRALQALASQSSMANALRGQDFGEESAKASAADQMQRFNVANQMAIQQRNVAMKNAAQESNLANLQNISNQNIAQANQERYNQLARQRQFWADKLSYAQSYRAPLGAYGQAGAQQAQQIGQANANMYGNIFGGIASGIGAAYNMNAQKQAAAQQSPTANRNYVETYGQVTD